jgi:hypothetical protein
MTTIDSLALAARASIAGFALLAPIASAELPTHYRVVTLRPAPSDNVINEEGSPEYSGFGAAVAIRNGIAFVGMRFGLPPRVAVYGQTATGWTRTATLTVSDVPIAGSNGFGSAIVFRDGLAVIASRTLLHVFRRSNGVWIDVQKLAPPPGSPLSTGAVPTPLWVISSMRLENGILAVGSFDAAADGHGVVYIHELGSNGKFVRRTTLRPSDSDSLRLDSFGSDVGVAGNTVVVGEPQNGAAYVFRRTSDGAWIETQKLVGADSSPVGSFGRAVAIDRSMIIVGAPWHECLETADTGSGFCTGGAGRGETGPDGAGAGGAAYDFVPVGGQYIQVFKLRPRGDEHSNYFDFGRRIAMMGKFIVVDASEQSAPRGGVPQIDFAIANGLSFTYARDGTTVTARGVASGYSQSESIGLANNWLLVGSSHDPTGACQTELHLCFGEATVFDLNRFEE